MWGKGKLRGRGTRLRSRHGRVTPAALALAVAAAAVLLLSFAAISGAAPGTDANVSNYDQCANDQPPSTATDCPGGWINGILNANNSHYAEDDVTPQRTILDLPNNGPLTGRTVEISYLTRKGGHHAYDSLATWNHTQTSADRCQGLSGADCVGGSANAFPIPLDPTVVNDSAGGGATSAHQLTGQNFVMYGGTITDVSDYTHDDAGGTSDSYAHVTLTYSVPATPTKVMLLFGGHLAASLGPRGWGPGLGAGTISGGPYHIRITGADGASVGNRDNQIMSGAILAPANIVIVKHSVGGDATFNYTATGGITSPFQITTSSGTGQQAFNDLTAGSYSVTEGAQSTPWSFTSLVCDDPDSGTTVSSQTANIDLDPGETVTCTYTNTFQKQAATVTTDIHDGSHQVITSAAIGSTVHDKAAVSGAFGPPTGTVDFAVYFGNTTCSGTATATGNVALSGGVADPSANVPVPAGGLSFKAHYNGDSTYNAGDGPCEPLTGTKLNPTVTTDVHNGSHQVITSAPIGSTVHDKALVSGSQGVPSGTVSFTVWSGNTTCTGQGAAAGTVTLAAGVADPSSNATVPVGGLSFRGHYNGDGTYNAGDGPCESLAASKLTPTVTTDVHNGSHQVITSAPTGATVHDKALVSGSQGVPSGTVSFTVWSGNTTCTGQGAAAGTVTLAAGVADPSSNATVPVGGLSFRGHYNGDDTYNAGDGPCESLSGLSAKLKVVKDFQGAPADAKVTLRIRQGGTTNASGQAGDGGSVGPVTLPPGVYSVDEAHVAGNDVDLSLYTSSISCSNGASGSGTALDVTLANGDDVTCTITNVRKASSITVEKSVSATSNGTYGTSASKPEPGGTFFFKVVVTNTSSADDVTITDLSDIVGGGEVAVSNLICEGATAGNPDGIPFTLAPGASKTCTFTRDVTGQPGTSETDHVDASWTNEEGTSQPDASSNPATVTITNIPSSITVVKTANPTSMQEPGGPVTFTVSVRNDSAVDTVMITSLVDSIHGNLNGQGTCLVPQTILPGATYTCAFTATVSKTETDVVTASGVDDDSSPVSASDDATVTITAAPPPPTTTSTPETMDVAVVKDATAQVTLGTDGTAVIDYEARVRNNGPNQAHNVMLADPAPSGVVFLAITQQPSQGSCTLTAALLSCNFGTLGPGVQMTVRWNARVNVTGSIRNVATATGQGTDTNSANNTDDAVTLVVAPVTPPAPPAPKPKPKPKPAPEVCRTLAVGPKLLQASGKSQTVTIKVVEGKKPGKGVKVRITGPGINRTVKTNTKGIVRVTLKPTKAGILRFSITNAKACNTQRIGVVGVFEPPVTG